MPTAEFEPAIPTTERPQKHALDRAATEISLITNRWFKIQSDFLGPGKIKWSSCFIQRQEIRMPDAKTPAPEILRR